MKEYREFKKNLSGVKLSAYTPIPPLTQTEKETFTELYQDLLIFSNQFQHHSEIIYVDDMDTETTSFLTRQRPYFYAHIDAVIDSYIDKKKPAEELRAILEDIRGAKFDQFYLLSRDKESAVLIDSDEKLYNIQALHSPFDTIFSKNEKYLMVETALIPFKNRYISDGLYNVGEVPAELEEYFNNLPFKNPAIDYGTKSRIVNIPIVLNFSISSNINKFKKMEEIILEQVSHRFTQGLIDMFENPYAHRINFVSAFLRSADLLYELNSEEGEQTFSYILGGMPVLNFEIGTKTDVIPYDILKRLYRQKSLKESRGYASYSKAKNRNLLRRVASEYLSFYSVLGIAHIEEDKYDDLENFLEVFDTIENREMITTGVENLFDELSSKAGFVMTPVYLGAGLELDTIEEEIGLYRDYIRSIGSMDLDACRDYSINKWDLIKRIG